ncbi:MAG: hypothetical protein PHH77_02075 [Victivallaceae bacterium]|nr:hypothetical protein [Victivallaceae bacterium]
MQCRCRRIIITRRVVNSLYDPVLREICYLLMAGFGLKYVRFRLKLPVLIFEIFIDEIKCLLLEAGLEVRRI